VLGVVLLTSATVALMLALTWAGFATLGRRRWSLGPVESALKHIAQAIGKGNGADKPGRKPARKAPAASSRAAAGAGKPAPGPSDELDHPIEEEATA